MTSPARVAVASAVSDADAASTATADTGGDGVRVRLDAASPDGRLSNPETGDPPSPGSDGGTANTRRGGV